MRETSNVFALLAIFFVPVAVVYTLWTTYLGVTEWAGITALWLLAAMNTMAAFYLKSAVKKLDRDPGDNPRGDIADSAGDYGFFSPGSGWPIVLAAAATLLAAGLAIGWWVFIIGVVIGVVSLIGWSFEYFRGDII